MALNRVVVCDDDDGTRETFVASVNGVVGREVAQNYTATQLKSAINALYSGGEPTIFDDADVAVIDNRLIDEWTAPDDPKVSAEQLADLVRTGSTARAVVVLNQYREIDFDLRLDGRLDSYADLNITDKCLGCEGLWVESPSNGFRPWSWPVLDRLVTQSTERQAWLLGEQGRLDKPLLQELGLADERVVRTLSRVAADFLHPEQIPSEVTFRSFVQGATRATDCKDRMDLSQDDALVAKIAAARLGKWLDAAVLAPQDVLVDVPHLLERFPCLVADPTDITSWNSAVRWSSLEGFKAESVAAHLWPLWKVWLSRPAYLWPLVQDDEALSKELLACFENTPPAEVGFCEDISRFLPINETREFVANFDSAFDRRRVAATRPAGFAYGPANRLAR